METLYKRTKGGKIQQWTIEVMHQLDDTATITVSHGLTDGQKQVDTERITEGKNAGKKNATTAVQQATKEAKAKWQKKLDRERYGLTVEESDVKMLTAPMLAHVYEDHADKVNWDGQTHVQPKFDGHRCIAIKNDTGIQLLSRQGVPITSCDHLIEQLSGCMPNNSIFDGELYIHGLPLNTIGSYIRRKQEASADLCYMMYDMPSMDAPFIKRYKHLLGTVRMWGNDKFPNLHIARTEEVQSETAAMEFQVKCIENGYEGAMLRHGDYEYLRGKRCHGLLKMKTFQDDEFEVIDCQEGRGKFEGMAIFTCITKDEYPFDVTAPGTHEEKKAYWESWPQHKNKMLTVKYQNYSATNTPVPVFPVALQFREDV
jgi:ATP-dependent DNA ligase